MDKASKDFDGVLMLGELTTLAKDGDLEGLKELFEANATGEFEGTGQVILPTFAADMLFTAAQYNQLEVGKWLLSNERNLLFRRLQWRNGTSPIHMAAEYG